MMHTSHEATQLPLNRFSLVMSGSIALNISAHFLFLNLLTAPTSTTHIHLSCIDNKCVTVTRRHYTLTLSLITDVCVPLTNHVVQSLYLAQIL